MAGNIGESFSLEDDREWESLSVDDFIQFENQLCLILYDFEECIYKKILAVTNDFRRRKKLVVQLELAKNIRKLLSEVSEKLSGADTIGSHLLPKIAEIERLVEELSVPSDLSEDEQGDTCNEVVTECDKIGGCVREVL